MIESNPRQFVLPLGYDRLHADRFVLVHAQVKYKHFALGCDRRKHRARVGSPLHVAHRGTQVEDEQRFATEKKGTTDEEGERTK